jgi:hypothetical protein
MRIKYCKFFPVFTIGKIGNTSEITCTPKVETSSIYIKDEISISKEAKEYIDLLETLKDAPEDNVEKKLEDEDENDEE